MSKINDGGPAFPLEGRAYHEGMSLRDHFAGQALASIMQFGGSDMWNETRQYPMTVLAYDMADAMLKAREARP